MKTDRRVFCFSILIMLCSAALLPARGGRDGDENLVRDENVVEEVAAVQITGIVRLVGNAPFSQILISGSGRQWYVVEEEMNKLYDLQHRTVTVEGEETVIELTFANGTSAGTRRYLRNIRIINIEEYTGP